MDIVTASQYTFKMHAENFMTLHHDSIDILMATYNGAAFVAQQIDSILAQDYPHIRLIIRDDGSTDTTRSILEVYAHNYPSQIVLLPSIEKSEKGVGKNFSVLMSHATANYVMLADQDDVWMKDKVRKTLEKMKESEVQFSADKPLLVHTDLTVVDKNLKMMAPSFWRYSKISPMKTKTLNRLLVQPVVTGCTVMMNRELLKLALPIPQDCVMHDSWLALVSAALGQVIPMPDSFILYRQHNKNTVGARKFWSLGYLKSSFDKLSQPETKKFNQGRILLSRYRESLNEENQKTITAYLSLKQSSFFQRAYLIFNHGLLRDGFLRNAVAICCSRLYQM